MSADFPSAEFPPETASARHARAFVASALALPPDTKEIVELLVSELASNAILHGRTRFTVTVSQHDTATRVSFFDRNNALPAVKDYGPDAVTGRGLRIVERLADRWGIDQPPTGGKAVWFEIGDVAMPEAASR